MRTRASSRDGLVAGRLSSEVGNACRGGSGTPRPVTQSGDSVKVIGLLTRLRSRTVRHARQGNPCHRSTSADMRLVVSSPEPSQHKFNDPARPRSHTMSAAPPSSPGHPSSPHPAEVRLLGAQRQRRPGRQQDRAAHRLGLRVQQALARLAENNGFEYALSPGALHGVVRRGVPARVDQHQPRAAAGDRAAQGDRRRPPRPVAARRAGQVGRHRRPDLRRPGRDQRRVSGWFKDEFTKLGEPWLEHGERYRRAEEFIRYVREIWTSDARRASAATSTGCTTSTSSPSRSTSRAAAPRDLPGRQLHRRPRDGRPGRRLVLHERQHARRASPSRSSDVSRRRARARPRGRAASASTAS